MPCTSAVCASSSIEITPFSPDTSRPGTPVAARGRKRFEVFLASRTVWPAGMAAYDARRRATAFSWAASPVSTEGNLLRGGLVRRNGALDALRRAVVPPRAWRTPRSTASPGDPASRITEVHDDALAGELADPTQVGLTLAPQPDGRLESARPGGDRHRDAYLEGGQPQTRQGYASRGVRASVEVA